MYTFTKQYNTEKHSRAPKWSSLYQIVITYMLHNLGKKLVRVVTKKGNHDHAKESINMKELLYICKLILKLSLLQ